MCFITLGLYGYRQSVKNLDVSKLLVVDNSGFDRVLEIGFSLGLSFGFSYRLALLWGAFSMRILCAF